MFLRPGLESPCFILQEEEDVLQDPQQLQANEE